MKPPPPMTSKFARKNTAKSKESWPKMPPAFSCTTAKLGVGKVIASRALFQLAWVSAGIRTIGTLRKQSNNGSLYYSTQHSIFFLVVDGDPYQFHGLSTRPGRSDSIS